MQDAAGEWSLDILADEFGYEVTGIEYVVERAAIGKQLNVGHEDKVNLLNGDYHNLAQFPDNYFDGVYTMETLVHSYSYQLALSEFLRVLKPGGKLVLFEYSIPELDSVPVFVRHLAERVIRNTGMASLPYFTHGSFPEILEKAGFEKTVSNDISKHVYSSWFYLFKNAIRESFDNVIQGKIGLDFVPGSMWIWPARHKLKYVISEAYKPEAIG